MSCAAFFSPLHSNSYPLKHFVCLILPWRVCLSGSRCDGTRAYGGIRRRGGRGVGEEITAFLRGQQNHFFQQQCWFMLL